jgi:hypothetical protein
MDISKHNFTGEEIKQLKECKKSQNNFRLRNVPINIPYI